MVRRSRVAISPDGKVVATYNYVRPLDDQRTSLLKLWNAETGAEIGDPEFFGKNGERQSPTFSPDGRILAFRNYKGDVVLVGGSDGKYIRTLSNPYQEARTLVFSKDGARLYGRSLADKSV